jgi:anti-anti-sigma factor
MALQEPPTADYPVVSLHGDLDLVTADDALTDVLHRASESADAILILDMSGVTFMDSQGLRALLSARTTLQQRGRELVLRRPPRTAMLVMEICGVLDQFTIEPQL